MYFLLCFQSGARIRLLWISSAVSLLSDENHKSDAADQQDGDKDFLNDDFDEDSESDQSHKADEAAGGQIVSDDEDKDFLDEDFDDDSELWDEEIADTVRVADPSSTLQSSDVSF